MKILLFDGECNLCNGAVQFLIKRDSVGTFKLASLQSRTGEQLVEKYKVPTNHDSFVYIREEKVFIRSDAALYVSKDLGGMWRLAFIFICLPRGMRDKVYDYVARNRYKWFGKRDSCMLPTPEIQNRFLDE